MAFYILNVPQFLTNLMHIVKEVIKKLIIDLRF